MPTCPADCRIEGKHYCSLLQSWITMHRMAAITEVARPAHDDHVNLDLAGWRKETAFYWTTRQFEGEAVSDLLDEIERLRDQLKIAHKGLARALDFRTASPDGLDIKEDVRDALRRSGNPGPWGYVGDGY